LSRTRHERIVDVPSWRVWKYIRDGAIVILTMIFRELTRNWVVLQAPGIGSGVKGCR